MSDTLTVFLSEQQGSAFWSSPGLAALIGLAGALLGALIGASSTRKVAEAQVRAAAESDTQTFLTDALKWFEGKTQPRSIGIAVVRANWDAHKEMRASWVGILQRQAIYLLLDSDQRGKESEVANLAAIMSLLVRDDIKATMERDDCTRLARALHEHHKAKGAVGVGMKPVPERWLAVYNEGS